MLGSDFPIIDLHCHFEGSIDPEVSYQILRRHGHPSAHDRREFLRQVTGFTPGSDAFFAAISLLDECLLDGPSVAAVVEDLVERAEAQNVKILEMSFAPRTFKVQDPQTARLDDFMEAFLTAIDTATRDRDIAVGLTMLILPYHFAPWWRDQHGDIHDIILEYRDHLTGVDICTLDFFPNYPEFEPQLPKLCETVREAGLHLSAHAGEFYDARPVERAIELGVERIGHGIRTIEDRKVLEQVVAHDITLEVCPVSNYKTGALAADAEHPLLRLLRAGVRVTINSDDQGVQGSNWRDDYDFAMHTIGLTEDDIKTCLRNSFEASFQSLEVKKRYRQRFVDGNRTDKQMLRKGG